MCHVKFFLWEGLVNAIKKEWMPARYKLNVWKTRFKTLNKGKGFLFLFIRISLANLFILVITHSLFEGHYGPQGTAESRNSTDHKSSGKKYPIPGCEICHYLISMTILLSLCCRFLFCYPKISHWQPVSETQPSNGIMLIKKNPQIPFPFFPITGRENSLLWLLRQKRNFQKDLFILGVLDTLTFLAFHIKVNPIVYFLFHFSFLSLPVFPSSLKHTGSASCERQLFADTNVH